MFHVANQLPHETCGEISPISQLEKSHIIIYATWYQNVCVENENRDEVSRLFGSYVGQH